MRKKSFKKPLLIALALVLVCVVSVAGTLAYLSAQTESVVNTFAVGDLIKDTAEGGEFVLKEHKANYTGNGVYTLATADEVAENTYDKILPGVNVPKDPFVRVKGLEVDAYLFLEVLDSTGTALTATVDSAIWEETSLTPKQTGATVYVYKGTDYKLAAADETTISILVNNTVIVDPAFNGESGLSISFKAYMCQYNGVANYTAAWDAV